MSEFFLETSISENMGVLKGRRFLQKNTHSWVKKKSTQVFREQNVGILMI